MVDRSQAKVCVTPVDAAKRRAASWTGVSGEVVHFVNHAPFEYHYQAPAHLFIASHRAIRAAGETKVEGLPPSNLRDLGNRMCFVPAGLRLSGASVPRIAGFATYIYIAPEAFAGDPDLAVELEALRWAPHLFFQDAGIWTTASKLTALIERPDGANRIYAEALSLVLAMELVRLQRGAPSTSLPVTGGLTAWQQRAVCEYIEDHIADDVSLAELAGLTRLSSSYFSRAFKKTLGVSPQRYQIERRIERAKRLLADPKQSVVDVALACGFGYSSNFSAAFRKITGATPTAFKRSFE